ncbi:MAG: hypothetical protein R3288_14680, partial [Woeseiaceae bacterium]|nr:hypothetical protein [Woeseiaceae bacterium]
MHDKPTQAGITACHRLAAISLVLALTLTACSNDEAPADVLPSLGATGDVTVSGISSGGYMAGQYLVAFSGDVDGAAIVAAGPWGCARGDIGRALQSCISGDGLAIDELHELAAEKAGAGAIDATSKLSGTRALLFHGARDTVVGGPAVDALERWLVKYIDDSNIRSIRDVPVAHGWPTLDHGGPCDTFAAPYINRCGFDLAGEILAHLHGELDGPEPEPGSLHRFDQRPFGDASLADYGYVYVPVSCKRDAGCAVHIFFHGCEQSAETIGTELADGAGFNRWAESNDI